jgi:cytochrome bd-type quinol oxidase subunit 2
MNSNTSTEAGRLSTRQMQRRVAPFILLYLVSYLFFSHSRPAHNSAMAYAQAACLGLSMVAMFVALAIFTTKQRDEFQRRLLMQETLWALCATFAITTVWGMLEMLTDLPRLPVLASFPIFIVIMAVAKVTLFRRNRAADE